LVKFAQQLAQDRLCPAAVGTFEVAVFSDGYGRVDRAANVVAPRVHVGIQIGERFVAAEERAPAQPGREMRCDAEEQPR